MKSIAFALKLQLKKCNGTWIVSSYLLPGKQFAAYAAQPYMDNQAEKSKNNVVNDFTFLKF